MGEEPPGADEGLKMTPGSGFPASRPPQEPSTACRIGPVVAAAVLSALVMGGCLTRTAGNPPLPYVKPANSVPQADPSQIQFAARMQQMDAELQRLWDTVERLKAAGGDEREINELRNRIAFIERQLGVDQAPSPAAGPPPRPAAHARQQPGFSSPAPPVTPLADRQGDEHEPPAPAVEIRNAPVSSEQQAFKQAYAAFSGNSMDQAIQLFEAFLKQYPRSELSSSAVYWIGEAHFAQGRYDEAVLNFDRVLKEFPGSKKELSALLKQGQAFEKMGDTTSARYIFQKLISDHPHSVQARMAAGRLKSMPAAAAPGQS